MVTLTTVTDSAHRSDPANRSDRGEQTRAAIAAAASRIERYHRAGMQQPYAVDTDDGVRCERILRPIGRVGLYVPAGGAPLPSTAIMLGIPARIAGCRRSHPLPPVRVEVRLSHVDPAHRQITLESPENALLDSLFGGADTRV
mgnify:CR=1 FL=1